jgi:O-methyltransferase involved in polyketide biosynthesis
VERIPVELSGVPETVLWNLGRRAAAARARRPLLQDPHAVELVDRLDYDFGDVSRGAGWHAVRVMTFDAGVRRFLDRHPDGTVVALGEGLETQFWRVDNGQVQWVTVDLPEMLALRRRLLVGGPRQRAHAGSALDLEWLTEVDTVRPVLVTAQGLLMYFHRDQVHGLIAALAERLSGAQMVFDTVPEKMFDMVQRAPGRESEQATQLWKWKFNASERNAISVIPGVATIDDLAPPLGLGVAPCVLGVVRRLPRSLRYSLPVLPVLELTFGARS